MTTNSLMQNTSEPIKQNEMEEIIKNSLENAKTKYTELINDIQDIAKLTNASRLFEETVFQLILSKPENEPDDISTTPIESELLAYTLYPFFTDNSENEVDSTLIQNCIRTVKKLLICKSQIELFSREREDTDIHNYVKCYTSIVRGSSYPEQTSEKIISIQGHFESWFEKKTGIGPKKAVTLLWNIVKKEEIIPKAVSRTDFNILSARPSNTEWDALCSLIGLTKDNIKEISDPIEIKNKTLYVLPNNKVILIHISNALDTLWYRFDEIAKQDQQFYDKRYQKIKTKWLDEKTKTSLGKIFPSSSIYHSLSYPDPNNKLTGTTEIDFIIYFGDFLILIENKAKQFRIESQLGKLSHLRSDLKVNIEEAYEQANRALSYINQTDTPEFIEISSNKKLGINKNDLHRVYLLTVSFYNFVGLATRLSELENVGFFKDHEYPISICISDLELITEFCPGPDVFLHYIEKRVKTQKESVFIMADEIELFGAYLQTRLQPERIWKKEGERSPNRVWLSDYQDDFDKWISFKRGSIKDPPKIELEVPEIIKEILNELRKNPYDNQAYSIAFELLNLSDRSLDIIAKMIQKFKNLVLESGKINSLIHQDSDIVISILKASNISIDLLSKKTTLRAIKEKYIRKCSKSIGIGMLQEDVVRPYNHITFADFPWEYDEQLENNIKSENGLSLLTKKQLPGRNDPCICGSGKKFKKCCLPRVSKISNYKTDNKKEMI